MTWLLDTNSWIQYLSLKPTPVQERLRARQADQIVICDIVKAELFFGAYKSQRIETNLVLLQRLFGQFRSLPFDEAAAQLYGELRTELTRKGRLIGPYDMQIAAIALVNRATLVTHNTEEFSRVVGLSIEDWETI